MDKRAEFVRLLNEAIAQAELVVGEATRNSVSWKAEDARAAVDQFERIRSQAQDGTLQPSQGAGLGIARALGEWAPKELYSAGYAVEEFFKEHWS